MRYNHLDMLPEMAFRPLGGRMTLEGGGGGSSSSSSNATTTNNTDKRLVVDNGVGVSSDSSTVNVTSTSSDPATIKAALDAVTSSDALRSANFNVLVNLADKLFTGAGEVIAKTQDTALGQINSLNTAANDAKGTIDQKTLTIIAIAGAAAFALRGKL